MPSNPCLHICVQDVGSIPEEEIQYTNCVCDVKCGVITPLCLTNTGEMGYEAAVLCKFLAGVTINTKHHKQCYTIKSGLRCHLSFAIPDLPSCALMAVTPSPFSYKYKKWTLALKNYKFVSHQSNLYPVHTDLVWLD